MRAYRKLLAYYSLIGTSGLFVASFIFIPRPENFLLLLLFLPVCLYLFLGGFKVPTPNSSDTVHWSQHPKAITILAVLIIFTLLIANLTIYSFLTLNKVFLQRNLLPLPSQVAPLNDSGPIVEELKKIQLSEASQTAILKNLAEIQADLQLIKLSLDLKNQVLGAAVPSADKTVPTPTSNKTPNSSIDSPTILGHLTINTVRWKTLDVFKQKNSTEIIGQIEYGQKYSFTKKESSWYQIVLPDQRTGWVNQPYLKEVE